MKKEPNWFFFFGSINLGKPSAFISLEPGNND